MQIQFPERKSIEEVTYTQAPLEPQEVQYLERNNRNNRFLFGFAILVTLGILGGGIYLYTIGFHEVHRDDDPILLFIIALTVSIVMVLVARARGRQIQRDLASRMKLVLHTALWRKKIDKDDGRVEYELNFEGLSGDLDVKKDIYDRMVEGQLYELEVSQHAKYIFRIRDRESKEVLYSLI